MMRLSRALTIALLMSAALIASEAHAQCGSLKAGNSQTVTWQGGSYDVFDPTEYVQAVTFDLEKTGGGQCDYIVGISVSSTNGLFDPREMKDTSYLDHNVYDDASQTNILQDLPSGGTVLSGSFTGSQNNETHTLTLYWVIPKEQVEPFNTQDLKDKLTLEVYQDDGGWNQEGTADYEFRANIPAAVEVSLVDTGGGFNVADTTQLLDFGTLTLGESLAFDLRVRGNTPFDVSLQSANSGVMVHAAAPEQVAYTLDVDGGPVDLSSGGAVTIASFTGAATTIEGEVYVIDVTIGAVAGYAAGTFQDNITVTVSAQ